jgi:hypothetical protein
VISATQAPSRTSPSWPIAGRHADCGRLRIARRTVAVRSKPHQEVDPCGAQLVGQLVRGGGAVGPDHDLRVLDDVAWELFEGQLDDLEVIGGGVGARVARAQHAGQRLARLVEVGQQRVKPKAAAKGAAAPSFSECAVINVASMSMMICPGAAPAFQAFSRARARAARSASSS